jgi:hypothetical protein
MCTKMAVVVRTLEVLQTGAQIGVLAPQSGEAGDDVG